MSKFEKKFGKYAIKNLTVILIACYIIGYLIKVVQPEFFNYLTLDPYMIIHKFQFWRLVTWLLSPPSSLNMFTVIMLLFYYSIGTNLEMTWGTYRYNIYLLLGLLFTALGAFLLYGYYYLAGGAMTAIVASSYISVAVSTYFVNMSIFLAYSATYPDNRVLLFFIIPIKVKWLGVFYAVSLIVEGINTQSPIVIVMMVASLLNFVVFYIRLKTGSLSPRQLKRRIVYVRQTNNTTTSTATEIKVCAKCGARSDEHPDYSFRYCSKCKGNLQYCQEHLFSHTHVE